MAKCSTGRGSNSLGRAMSHIDTMSPYATGKKMGSERPKPVAHGNDAGATLTKSLGVHGRDRLS